MGARHSNSAFTRRNTQVKELGECFDLWVGTWNLGNEAPPDDLSPFIPRRGYELFVVGTQECSWGSQKLDSSELSQKTAEELEEPDRKVEVKAASMVDQKDQWYQVLSKHFGPSYHCIAFQTLGEIKIAAFVEETKKEHVRNIFTAREACGLGNVGWNKGAVAVSLTYHETRMCFINAHLAAHQDRINARNRDFQKIIKGISERLERQAPRFGLSLLYQYHYKFFFGDLNYRIHCDRQGVARSPPEATYNEICADIKSGNLDALLKRDQLSTQIEEKAAFTNFEEQPILFRPTFKVDRAPELKYMSQRTPSWTDRILYRSLPGFPVQPISYDSAEAIGTSDHKPVFGTFLIPIIARPAKKKVINGGNWSVKISNLRATKLLCGDLRSSDPYVEFKAAWLPRKGVFKTATIANNLNPVWQDDQLPDLPCQYNSAGWLSRSLLYIKVWDEDRVSEDDLLGQSILPLAYCIPNGPAKDFDLELSRYGAPAGRLTGTLQISVATPPDGLESEWLSSHQETADFKTSREMKDLEQKWLAHSRKCFDAYDVNGDSLIEFDEVVALALKLGSSLEESKESAAKLFELCGLPKTQKIPFSQFNRYLRQIFLDNGGRLTEDGYNSLVARFDLTLLE